MVGVVGLFVSYYARGYRLDFSSLTSKGIIKFQPNGILVIKSDPDGASVYIDGILKTATNATISISPGTYDVEVRREGYFTWYKRLTIERRDHYSGKRFSFSKMCLSLSPITFSGAQNPVASEDGTRIAYIDKDGLWYWPPSLSPWGFPMIQEESPTGT